MKIDYANYYWQNELVRLRAMKPDDWSFVFPMEFDGVARRKLNYHQELPPTEENRKSKTEQHSGYKSDDDTSWLVFIIETLDGKFIGYVNLNSIDERHGTFSVGIQVVSDECGKGYGTAAMRIIMCYAFNERRLNKYYGSVIESNTASATMLKKLGCTQEGVRREQIFMDGRYWNEVLYGMTAKDYRDKNALK